MAAQPGVEALTVLTAAQVGEQLAISPRAVYELFASRRLAGYRFGRVVRFDQADVDAFKAACRVEVVLRPPPPGPMRSTTLRVAGGSSLAEYFRKAGVTPRPDPRLSATPAKKAGMKARPYPSKRR